MNLLSQMDEFKTHASRAVQELDEEGKLTNVAKFPIEQAESVVHSRELIVSLNPGSEWDSGPAWANFHIPLKKHNDIFLAAAFLDTSLWGAYMVDLHPDIAQSRSELIRAEAEEVELKVQSLIRQAKLLGDVETILCVGAKSHGALMSQSDLIEMEVGISTDSIKGIIHYSGSNAGLHGNKAGQYRTRALETLGLN